MTNKQYLIFLRKRMHTTINQCALQSNDDFIDFENGKCISICDIALFKKEYKGRNTNSSFTDYLLEQTAAYIEGKRELPN